MNLFTFPRAICAHCHSVGCNRRVVSDHYCSAQCASAGPRDVPMQSPQETEMARKSNGHAVLENAPSEPTGDAAPAIAARVAVDALDGESIEGLRQWLNDNLGAADDVARAMDRWDADPEGMRRELQNLLAFHLSQDDGALADLGAILNGEKSALPPEPEPRTAPAEPDATATEGDAERVEAFRLEADGPAPRIVAPKPVVLAARQLKGGLVAYILDLLRVEQDGDRRPWSQRPEAHQREVIARVNERVEDALRHGFMAMIGERPRVIGGTLDTVTAKEDGVKAVIKIAANAENLLDLLRGAGERVQIAVADPGAFMGMGDGVPVTLDQTILPLEPEPAPAQEAAEVEEVASDPAPASEVTARPMAEPPAMVQ